MYCWFFDISKYLDLIVKIATIIIAISNLIFAIVIYNLKDKKDDKQKDSDRKISWLKTLVLDQSLKYFYDFFDELEATLKGLQTQNLDIPAKQQILNNASDHFIKLRRKFIDTLLAVDKGLYDDILKKSDDLQTHLSEKIFDQGINLSHQPKFDEVISERLTTAKTDIIKKLFQYKG